MTQASDAGPVTATPSATAPLRYDPFEVGACADPYPVYERLREEAPLYRHEEGNLLGALAL